MKTSPRCFWFIFLLLTASQLSALAKIDVTNLVEQGFAKEESGDLDGALADSNKAIDLKPDYARAFKLLGDFSGALADFNRAVEIRPNSPVFKKARDETQQRLNK
jgi:tetratricopeptide (TPR) repeat protein